MAEVSWEELARRGTKQRDPRLLFDALERLTGKKYGNIKQTYSAPPASPPPTASPVTTTAAPSASGNLWSQYQTRLAPITKTSEDLLRDYLTLAVQAPTFAQKLLDSIKQAGQYPSHAAMREEYAQNPDLTPMAIESLVSRRGMSTRGTIQDIITRASGGLESDIESRRGAAEMAQTQRANLLEEYGFEYGAQQDILDRLQTGRGTPGERAVASAKKQAELDASRGATSQQLARAYGSVLEPWEILQIYNKADVYGPIEDSTGQFYKWLPGYEEEGGLDMEAVEAYVSMVQSGEINLTNVPSEYRDEVSKRVSQGGTGQGTNLWGRIGNVLGVGG